jgi:Zn-dependent protease with chaperone function
MRWSGRLHDGQTAIGHAVEATLGSDALEITRADGTVVARWPYAALVAIEPLRSGQPAVLAPGADDDARLTLARPATFEALLDRAPQLAGGGIAQFGRGAARAALWVGVALAIAAALWFGWPKVADGLATLVPPGVAAHLGEQAREQLLDRTKPCDQAEGRAALEHLMARLTGAMHYDQPVTVTVVDLPVANAVALPGGQIVLFRQLITEAQSPEELAAVLAHELGHLAAHHPTRNLVRQFGLNLIIMALSGNSSWDGAAQYLVASAYTREIEAEADGRALDALRDAGIGGQGWIDFFTRHAGPGGSWDKAIAYLSSHPPSLERRDRAAALPPSTSPAMSVGEWLVLRSICGAPTNRPGPRPRP